MPLRKVAEDRLKPVAKAIYRPVVIAAMRGWRSMHQSPTYIGVTGSAGKTTTKELLHSALAATGPTLANSDSNNQLYAVARTLVGLRRATRWVVQELGAGEPGGMRKLLQLLRPSVGVVLNVGQDHRSAFRDPEATAAEKALLIAALPAGGLAVLNADDARVAAMAALTSARVLRFGLSADADVRGKVLESAWPSRLALEVSVGGRSVRIDTLLVGAHQAPSVLAAVATAHGLGLPLDEIARRIAVVSPTLGRMSVQLLPGDITVLRDDWKAPLWSLKAGLQVLATARAARRIVVLGTVSDYRGGSRAAYRGAIRVALACADQVILVGERAAGRIGRDEWREAAGQLLAFATVREAAMHLAGDLRRGDLLLLKGSNKADHLARIALNVSTEVGCWRRRCGRQEFCDRCGLLRQRSGP